MSGDGHPYYQRPNGNGKDSFLLKIPGEEQEGSRCGALLPTQGTREDQRALPCGSGAWKAGLLPFGLKHSGHSEGLYYLPASSLEPHRVPKDIENRDWGARVGKAKEPCGSPSTAECWAQLRAQRGTLWASCRSSPPEGH